MDSKILEQIKNIIDESIKHLATKDDLRNFATKDDLRNFATKDDLRNELEKYPTKEDLKSELSKYVTKDDLNQLEENLKEYTDQVFGDLMEAVEKHKADRTDIERLEKQISSL